MLALYRIRASLRVGTRPEPFTPSDTPGLACCCLEGFWPLITYRSNPEPSVASKLTEIVNLGSSTWPINKYCDIRNYPAGAILVNEPDDTYATSQPSSKTRPSVRGVACPPQWLPVLLTAASPSLSPPPSPYPSPPPSTSRRRLLNHVFTTKAELTTAVQAFDANPAVAIATYGPIAEWDVSAITDMSELFEGLENFDADISSWATSSVTSMNQMFSVRSSRAPHPQPSVSGPPLHAAIPCAAAAVWLPAASRLLARIPRPAPHSLLSTLGRARRRSTSR